MRTKRYECVLRLDRYKIRVNVFTPDESQIHDLARAKAVRLLNRVTKLPNSLLDIEVIGTIDRGFSPEEADALYPVVI